MRCEAEDLSRGPVVELEDGCETRPGLGGSADVEGGMKMERQVSTRRDFMTFSKPVWELSGKMVLKGDV